GPCPSAFAAATDLRRPSSLLLHPQPPPRRPALERWPRPSRRSPPNRARPPAALRSGVSRRFYLVRQGLADVPRRGAPEIHACNVFRETDQVGVVQPDG